MFNEEIEKAVLYYIIFRNKEFSITSKDFVSNRNRQIAEAIIQLKSKKQEISLLSVAEKIKGNKSDILSYISNLHEYVLGISEDVAFSKLIFYSKKRQVYEMLKKIEKDIQEEAEIDVLIEKTISDLGKIQSRNEQSVVFAEQVSDTIQYIEDSYNKRADYSLYTGLIDLDKKILGLHNQELTIIGARPGVGKTTLALQIAEHIARKGKWTSIVSLEMSENQLIQKMISRISKVNGYKLRSGNLEDNDFMNIAQVCNDLSQLNFHINSKCKTIQEIEVYARKLKNRNELDLLVIDYLQLIKNANRFGNREQEVADISRTLKLLSLELDVPIIGLCQLNRNATRNEPTLADLRESGSIEQDADNVLFLYKEEGQEEAETPVVILKIAKQRAGDVGKTKLLFKKASSEFVQLVR